MKVKSESEVAQSCPTLGDPMDCSPPGFSIHGIFQARVLEWGAIALSIYIYIYIYTHTHIYICVYIYIERDTIYTYISSYICYNSTRLNQRIIGVVGGGVPVDVLGIK